MRRGKSVRVGRTPATVVAHVINITRRLLAHRQHSVAGFQGVLEAPPVIVRDTGWLLHTSVAHVSSQKRRQKEKDVY